MIKILLILEYATYLFDSFYNFIAQSLTELPLSVSLASAITLTFLSLIEEIEGSLRLIQTLTIAMWCLVIAKFFISFETMGQYEIWALIFLFIFLNIAWIAVKRKGRKKYECRKCGNATEFYGVGNFKKGKIVNMEPKKCAKCGSEDFI